MTNIDQPAAPAPERGKFCASCGTPVSGGAFCTHCGASLAAGAAPLTPAPEPVQPSATGWAPTPRQDPGFVRVASVAGQTTEHVEVNGIGVVKLATINQRILARLIDYLVVSLGCGALVLVFSIIGAVFGAIASNGIGDMNSAEYQAYAAINSGASFLGTLLLGLFLAAVLAYVYEIAMTTMYGRTVGKMVVGARIIRAADGKKPNLMNAFLRWLAPGLGALIPFLGGLGSLLVLLSPTFDSSGRRQGWHDKMGSTLVVEGSKSINKGTARNLADSAKSAAGSIRNTITSK